VLTFSVSCARLYPVSERKNSMKKEYRVGNETFPIELGQDDHDALDKAIWHANDTWQDVYDENDELVWENSMDPNTEAGIAKGKLYK